MLADQTISTLEQLLDVTEDVQASRKLNDVLDDVLQIRDSLLKLQAAIDNPGRFPKYHKVKVDQIRLNWKPLWAAIEELIR